MVQARGPDIGLTTAAERRAYGRIDLRVPVLCRHRVPSHAAALRGVTRNVSPGGFFFETAASALTPGTPIEIELSVPALAGVSSEGGCVAGKARVVRVERLRPRGPGGPPRAGVAVEFTGRPQISF